MRSVAIITIGLILNSCASDPFESSKPVPQEFQFVEEAIIPYYQSFQKEAKERGLQIDLNNLEISAEIKEIAQEHVAGSCSFGSHINNHITIDKTFWEKASQPLREFVVFHELGHCALLRGHDESSDAQGRCLSIMRSGLGNCVDVYSPQNRKILLDELFIERE